MKVLYVACNPTDSDDLLIEREITELQRRALQSGVTSAQFHFLPSLAIEELAMELSRHTPDVLHLSAHGDDGRLELANAAGDAVNVTPDMLCAFLKYERAPKLVYLNACSSNLVAAALVKSKVVPMAIGTTAPITNRTARAAAVLFYDRILMGSTISDAFEAGKRLMEGLQNSEASSKLHVASRRSEHTERRLYITPRLVARADRNRYIFNRDGSLKLQLQLIGCPPNTIQVIFFTDDKSFITSDITDDETECEYLARELCQVIRQPPENGRVIAPDAWETDQDFRIYACGTTADGKTFSVSSTICDALLDYARFINKELSVGTHGDALAEIVNRLQNPDREDLMFDHAESTKTEHTADAERSIQSRAPKRHGTPGKPEKESDGVSNRTRRIRAVAFKQKKP